MWDNILLISKSISTMIKCWVQYFISLVYLRNKLFSLRGHTFYNVRVEVFAAESLMIADTCSLFRLVQHDWTCFGSYTKWDRRSVSLCVDRFVNHSTCFKIQTFWVLCMWCDFVSQKLLCWNFPVLCWDDSLWSFAQWSGSCDLYITQLTDHCGPQAIS